MKTRITIIYSWFIRVVTAWMPDVPFIMRFRGWLYSLMMKKCGRNLQVPSTVIFNSLSGLVMGDNVLFGHRAIIIGLDVEIGNEVLIGPNSLISGGNHTFLNGSYRFGPHVAQKVIIGEGSWICANCVVTAGSVLPDRSVLAAGSVLTKACQQTDSLYAGLPAKFLKQLTNVPEEVVA
ncbi:acyltransferase [Mucilaginibacter celer]|uniref:Acyltransferase n=1 Tax=Mucilaginibacter celer TaxID=2305508 RepID=A0A494VY88_9SPHI|nr:acyltransferase [Mucilaginibacter celer]AYL98430.1 acyltransferase [Mucilaginibacter celer]